MNKFEEIRTYIAHQMTSTAEWRRHLIDEFPTDEKRLEKAAAVLDDLADRADEIPDEMLSRIAGYFDGEGALTELVEALSEACRRVGFQEHPESPNDVLSDALWFVRLSDPSTEDGAGNEPMNVWTVEIEGRPVVAFGAEDDVMADSLIEEEWFLADLQIFEGRDGRSLWNGASEIVVRPASADEADVWRRSYAGALESGEEDGDGDGWVRFLIPVRDSTDEAETDGDGPSEEEAPAPSIWDDLRLSDGRFVGDLTVAELEVAMKKIARDHLLCKTVLGGKQSSILWRESPAR